MKSQLFRFYSTLIALILIAIYVALFLLFTDVSHSTQSWFFLILIPLIIALNWGALFLTASFRDVDSAIASGVSTVAVQSIYTVIAVIVSIILALAEAMMKVQIVIQLVLFGLFAIGMLISLFSASNAKTVNSTRAVYSAATKDVRKEFRETVDTAEYKGMKGSSLDELKELCDTFCHIAPCNDPAAAAVDAQISAELSKVRNSDSGESDGSISHLHFLIKRRASLRSR